MHIPQIIESLQGCTWICDVNSFGKDSGHNGDKMKDEREERKSMLMERIVFALTESNEPALHNCHEALVSAVEHLGEDDATSIQISLLNHPSWAVSKFWDESSAGGLYKFSSRLKTIRL